MFFVELPPFRRRLKEFMREEDLRSLQLTLMSNPVIGDVMPGCGGLRKMRWGKQKQRVGKRGGCRIIYLYHQGARRIDLVAIYGKNEQDDLTTSQRNNLQQMALHAKTEVAIWLKRQKGSK